MNIPFYICLLLSTKLALKGIRFWTTSPNRLAFSIHIVSVDSVLICIPRGKIFPNIIISQRLKPPSFIYISLQGPPEVVLLLLTISTETETETERG